ncbi:hypothetical protein F4779DRAFT_639869 [Xylariaceae sp. FL0662B]|nr:hypothetical protein F4779DRAFT_639869 [Xylariaceae sp. FL0662B]
MRWKPFSARRRQNPPGHSPLERLPNELSDNILNFFVFSSGLLCFRELKDHLANRDCLRSLCSTSKRLKHLAEPLLYRHMVFRRPQDLIVALRTLLQVPRVREQLRAVVLRFDPWKITSINPLYLACKSRFLRKQTASFERKILLDTGIYPKQKTPPYIPPDLWDDLGLNKQTTHRFLAAILCFASDAEELVLHVTEDRTVRSSVIFRWLESLVKSLRDEKIVNILPALRTLHFVHLERGKDEPFSMSYPSLAFLPWLDCVTIEGRNICWPEGVLQQKQTPIRSLVLQDMIVDRTDVAIVADCCPDLESLVVVADQNAVLQEFTLILRACHYEYTLMFDIIISKLPRLHNLVHLDIELRSLYGRRKRIDQDLAILLPPSLQSLNLREQWPPTSTREDEWSLEYEAKVESIVRDFRNQCAEKRPELRRFTFFIAPRTTNDLMRRMERLGPEFEEVGIHYDVQINNMWEDKMGCVNQTLYFDK